MMGSSSNVNPAYIFQFTQGAQSFTSLMTDLCQDMNIFSKFRIDFNGTFHNSFPWKNYNAMPNAKQLFSSCQRSAFKDVNDWSQDESWTCNDHTCLDRCKFDQILFNSLENIKMVPKNHNADNAEAVCELAYSVMKQETPLGAQSITLLKAYLCWDIDKNSAFSMYLNGLFPEGSATLTQRRKYCLCLDKTLPSKM